MAWIQDQGWRMILRALVAGGAGALIVVLYAGGTGQMLALPSSSSDFGLLAGWFAVASFVVGICWWGLHDTERDGVRAAANAAQHIAEEKFRALEAALLRVGLLVTPDHNGGIKVIAAAADTVGVDPTDKSNLMSQMVKRGP